jgi:molybdate transport system substrate-binding protein
MRAQQMLLATLAMVIMTATPSLATEIHVMSGGAPREVLKILTPRFEKQSGHTVKFTYAVITELRKRLDAGEKADMVLLPLPVIDAYIKAGKMRADSRTALANVGIAVIVRQGAAKPDIAGKDAFRRAMLAAKSVVHSTPTATPSGAHMAKVWVDLGIADALGKKVIHRPALDGGVALVANGEAEIGIYPASEVAHEKGVAVVGPLPPGLQSETIYSAAALADAAAAEPAMAFIRFLAAPEHRKVWQDAGFTPPNG